MFHPKKMGHKNAARVNHAPKYRICLDNFFRRELLLICGLGDHPQYKELISPGTHMSGDQSTSLGIVAAIETQRMKNSPHEPMVNSKGCAQMVFAWIYGDFPAGYVGSTSFYYTLCSKLRKEP